MLKAEMMTIELVNLVSDDNVNVRLPDNYDLETMEDQLIQTGRVTDALTVEPITVGENAGKYLILKGNRRYRASCRIVSKDRYSDAIKAPFRALACEVVYGLNQVERTNIIFDHGTVRGLNREETVKNVWRLAQEMRTTKEIANLMYTQLAQMGDTKKLAQIPTDASKREDYLATWFNGTLNQWILNACAMGQYVKDQFILSMRYQDGRLPKENHGWDLDLTKRERVRKLWAAKGEDEDGTGWNPETGGEKFNALLEEYRIATAGGGNNEPKKMSVADINKRVAQFNSPELQNALKATTGDKEAGLKLRAYDEALTRRRMIDESLASQFNAIKDDRVKELVRFLLSSEPAGGIDGAIAPFIADAPVIRWIGEGEEVYPAGVVANAEKGEREAMSRVLAMESELAELNRKLADTETRLAEAEAKPSGKAKRGQAS